MNTDQQYFQLIEHVLQNGKETENRTGINTIACHGTQNRYDCSNNKLPILCSKKVPFKTVLKELLWFISGNTNNQVLQEQKVKIWNANATREFLDSRGLTNNAENDLGPIYGFQWRHWGADYQDCHTNYKNQLPKQEDSMTKLSDAIEFIDRIKDQSTHEQFDLVCELENLQNRLLNVMDTIENKPGQGIDQLQNCIDLIKNDPTSRRIILSSWNVGDLDKMALPPCHAFVQFFVTVTPEDEPNELSCQLYQRSGDIGLGVPFNITSYSLLLHMIAHVTGTVAKEFIHTIGDAHIYVNHVDALQEQMQNFDSFENIEDVTIEIVREHETIDDFNVNSFVLHNYNATNVVRMNMAV